jgi:predicted nuclease of predicted toxin-antitoxin system
MNTTELKFLVDVGVGKGVENFLFEAGYDTKAVREINPRLEDEEIIRIAALENRMVITMDKDFGELVYHSGMQHSGILLLRLEDAVGARKLQVVEHIIETYSNRIKNCFCVFQNDRFRIKRINR